MSAIVALSPAFNPLMIFACALRLFLVALLTTSADGRSSLRAAIPYPFGLALPLTNPFGHRTRSRRSTDRDSFLIEGSQPERRNLTARTLALISFCAARSSSFPQINGWPAFFRLLLMMRAAKSTAGQPTSACC